MNGSNTLANGFPPTALSNPNAPELYSIQPNLRIPFNQQWHFGVQYQMPADTMLDVSYAGSHGQRLYGFYNGNQAAVCDPPAVRSALHRKFWRPAELPDCRAATCSRGGSRRSSGIYLQLEQQRHR